MNGLGDRKSERVTVACRLVFERRPVCSWPMSALGLAFALEGRFVLALSRLAALLVRSLV